MKIIVLGADKGLGKILSEMLASRGHRVAAGYVTLPEDEQKKIYCACKWM